MTQPGYDSIHDCSTEHDYRGFAEDYRAYRFKTDSLLRHWYNYLWNASGYFVQVSESGRGRSWHNDGAGNVVRVNRSDDRFVFIRDMDNETYWSIGQSGNTFCSHGLDFSRIETITNGLYADWTFSVSPRNRQEQWTVQIENRTEQSCSLRVYSGTSFELEGFSYPRYYETYRTARTEFIDDLNGIWCSTRHPYAPHDFYNAYFATDAYVSHYDGDLTRFLGVENTYTEDDASVSARFGVPRFVQTGQDCTDHAGSLFILGAVLQSDINLKPGERRVLRYALGISATIERAVREVDEFRSPVKIGVSSIPESSHKRTLSLTVPDTRITAFFQGWIQKQVDFCLIGKHGVRDNLQIAMAMLNYDPSQARRGIEDALSHQYPDGHAVLTWHPFDDTRYSDQPAWIVLSVCEYIKETGDFGFLEQNIPYEGGGAGSVFDHLIRAMELLQGDTGPNGLVRIRYGDWNDALNVADDEYAESVMVTQQYCLCLREMAELCRVRGQSEMAKGFDSEFARVSDIVNRVAWDGSWYLRAISRIGIIGGSESSGSTIYLNTQAWAILAGIVPEERIGTVYRAIDGMETDFGFPINAPPYNSYDPLVGRMSGMLPGLFENGGVYCHASAFKIMADCLGGRGDNALRTLRKIMPDSNQNPSSRSGAEPFVFTNCYALHPDYFGRSYQSWTTGTSGWALRGVVEGMLGLRRSHKGLHVVPALPSEWDRAVLRRPYRGGEYYIEYERCGPGNVVDVSARNKHRVDGVLPEPGSGEVVHVRVTVS